MLTIDGLRHLILPALTLAIYKASLVVRLAYAGTREALLQDFVRFARAKGLSQKRIVGVHVLKVILIPVVTVIGLELGSMIAFAVVTETVFAWPGMGKLLIESIYRLDRPVIVAYLMVVVVMFVVINFVVDMIYTVLDPRVRLDRQGGRDGASPRASAPQAAAPETRLRRAWSEFAENRVAVVALGAVVVLVILALAAPWITPQNPYDLTQLVDHGQHACPGRAQPRGQALSARHRRAGPRHAVRHALRPASEPVRRRSPRPRSRS